MANPMTAAIASAREGVRKGHGGPFGACIVKLPAVASVRNPAKPRSASLPVKSLGASWRSRVKRGKIIATAHNTVLRDRDPTAHAEINAIRRASRKLKTHDLSGCVLYATAEPCPMCLGAIYWARIGAVNIGVRAGAAARAGFDDALIREELKRSPGRRRIPMRAGIMQAACRDLFREWKKLNGIIY